MKILLLLHTYSADGDFGSFALELVEGFRKSGVEVHVIKANDLVDNLADHRLSERLDKEKIKQYFTKNKFDFVFTTNHAGLGSPILSYIESVPIVSWLVDRIPFIHNGKKGKRLFSNNTHVVTSSLKNVGNLSEKFALHEDKIHYFPFMTNPASFDHSRIKSENICFIGSYFMNEGVISGLLEKNFHNKYYKKIVNAISAFEKNFDLDDEDVIQALGLTFFLKKNRISPGRFKGAIGNIISNGKRLTYLEYIANQGLTLYGTKNIGSLAYLSPELVSCFNASFFVNSRERLCEIYDRTRIGLNINHHQATTGLGYRVFDILASSALLVTNKQKNSDLDYLFGETHPIPIYESPKELRKICYHFIKHQNEREQLVFECNKLVIGKHTFEQRAVELIRLVRPKFSPGLPEDGTVNFISSYDLCKEEVAVKSRLKLRQEAKQFVRSMARLLK